jgi:hypothetical protein
MTQRRLSDKEIDRLARYWFRAELMRDHVHTLVEGYKPHLNGLNKDNWWEFEAYLVNWIAGLFVLVEGFNRLKLRDARVQRLFNAHIGRLKAARHETYHFVVERLPFDETVFRHEGLNWAEQLHDAIGDHIKEIVMRRANVDRFMEARKAKRH